MENKKSIGMSIRMMDEYCRQKNRVLNKKVFPLYRGNEVVGKKYHYQIDNSDNYYVGK